MLKKLLLVVALFVPASLMGQGSVYPSFVVNPSGHPIPNALIRVCTVSSTGTPCTPKVTIYTDLTLGVVANNPAATDQFGNFSVFAPAGTYKFQITAPGGIFYQYFVMLPLSTTNIATPCTSGQFITAINLITPPTCATPTVAGLGGLPVPVASGGTGTTTGSITGPGALTFTPNGASIATVVNFADQGGQDFNVRSLKYSAKGDGATNDQTAIQSAIDDCEIANGTVFIGHGLFYHTVPFVLDGRCNIRGEGGDIGVSSILLTDQNIDQIQIVNGASGDHISRIGFQFSNVTTSGSGININIPTSVNGTGTTPLWLDENTCVGAFDCIKVIAANQIYINGLFAATSREHAISITGGLGINLLHLFLTGSVNTGVSITGGGAVFMNDVQTYNGVHGLAISNGVSQVFVDDSIFDSSSGDVVTIVGTGNMFRFNNTWIGGSAAGYGMNINQSGGGGLMYTGGQIRGNFLSGVSLAGTGVDYSWNGVAITGNGVGATGGNTYGVKVAANKTYFKVINSSLGGGAFDSNSQTHGVFITTGTSDHYQVTNNQDIGNTTLLVSDGGSGTHKDVTTGNVN